MTLLPGVAWSTQESLEDSLQRSAEELAWRLERCRNLGLTLAIEPHLGSVAATTSATARLLELTPDLTLTLDYGHFISQGVESVAVHRFLDHASHIHARGAGDGRLQVRLSDNQIDFATIIRRLVDQSYSGFVSVEYVWIKWQDCDCVDTLSETIMLHTFLQEALS
jgi:sugar phosphate isomerase/epimerase